MARKKEMYHKRLIWGAAQSRNHKQWFDNPAAAHDFMSQLEKSKRHRRYH
ncbi:MAG: hypothetical protein LAT81_14640 [Oceanicaulis sp.]|nr:hypothetical protein [Oceanicaulis sp.]